MKSKLKIDNLLYISIFLLFCVNLILMSDYYKNIGYIFFGISMAILFLCIPKKIYLFNNSYIWWYICMIITMIISSIYSVDPEYAQDIIFITARSNIPTIISIILYSTSQDKINNLMKLYIFVSIIMCIVMIKDAGIGSNNIRYGYTVTGQQPNIPALNLCGAFAFAYYFSLKNNGKRKIIYIIELILFTYIIFLTGSRKVLIFILGIIFLYTYGYDRKNLKKILTSILIILVGVCLIKNIPILYENIGSRIFIDLSKEESLNERAYLINTAIDLFKKKPLVGYGMSSFEKMNVSSVYSHNNYLELLTGMGIIGFLMFYSMNFITTFRLLKNIRNSTSFAFLSIMLMLFIIEFTQVTYIQRGIYIIYTLAFCQSRIKTEDLIN